MLNFFLPESTITGDGRVKVQKRGRDKDTTRLRCYSKMLGMTDKTTTLHLLPDTVIHNRSRVVLLSFFPPFIHSRVVLCSRPCLISLHFTGLFLHEFSFCGNLFHSLI